MLDEMARYKLNVFHFHLTDNGGWRIRIDKYPRLTAEGAFRTQRDWYAWWDRNDRRYLPEGTPGAYGGYFTKEDIREIVTYAAERAHYGHSRDRIPGAFRRRVHRLSGVVLYGQTLYDGRILCRQRTGIYFYGGCAYRSYGAFPFEIHPYRRRRGPESRLGDLSEMPGPDRAGET